ncbi:apolipoprotein N-acyltransferase [Trueperella bialowiezensis]|uniref:Apolipoprotein N-acyltransferase n=1 Tax=Trueperella bialowiezensis TaxID=312285 RepID=A0A448PBZ7_9ACTO|nr:apolipoprotein N-acyltransferase [Trueperella bialowiezensis]VEI12426.1 Apolipoprotein N-acyltransferase [Trueperella bialowiezensis]
MRFLAAIAGGVAMWLANEPTAWWALAFPAIALLWLIVNGRGAGRAFGLGSVCGAAFFLPLFHWATPAAGTALAQIALGLVEAIYIGVLAGVWALLSRLQIRDRPGVSIAIQIVTATLAWLAMEQLRSSWPFGGMPWGTLAFTMVDTPFARLAPYGSTTAVGGIVIVISLLVAHALTAGFFRGSVCVALAAMLAVVPIFVPVGGRSASTVKVAVVQGGPASPQAESRALAVTDNHVEATKELLERSEQPDFIVWPESSSDRDVRKDPTAGDAVTQLVEHAGVPLVMGTQEYIEQGRYNDVLVIEPQRGVTDRYSKQHPVPFGEYIPHRDFFRQFTDAVDLVSVDMLAGQGPAIVRVPTAGGELVLGVPICFEVAYTDIVADAVTQGAQLLVVPTNNASFTGTGLSPQQFAMSRFRAIEHSRTVIQVSTTAITGAINSRGRVFYEADQNVPAAEVLDIELQTKVTFAARSSRERTFIIYILGAVSAMVALAHSCRERRGQR